MMLIEINNKFWEVHKLPSTDPLLYYDNNYTRGSTWHRKQIIALSNELNIYTAPTVIAHELTHAFIFSTQMDIPETFTEEQICNFVADYGQQILDLTKSVYETLYLRATD